MHTHITHLPKGLGFGHGTISKKLRLNTKDLDEAALEAARELINDPESYTYTEHGDDGCGDGRDTALTYKLESGNSASLDGARRTFRRPGHRAKVFGGGLIMAWIMDRIVAGAPKNGQTALADRTAVAKKLRTIPLAFGGHTDNHASGDNCGCGAIDKSRDIVKAAITYCDYIEDILKVILGDHFSAAAFDRVMDEYILLAKNDAYMVDAQGDKTRRLLEKAGAVIKELNGSHNEVFVILNYVPGTTFNQTKLNTITDSKVQAFAVDIWRIDAYAEAVARWHKSDKQAYDTALCAGLVYTLAAAAVLTDGSQEIFVRTIKKQLSPAL
jgi:hypothetical protein